MNIVIDYDPSRKMGVIISEFLDIIRENFSQPDKTASIKRRRFGRKAFIPSRMYSITKGGRFELGLIGDILKYVKSLAVPYRVTFTDAFKHAYACSYSFYDHPLAEIKKPENYQQRDYQAESIKRGLKVGNGIFLLKTAAGKTYIMGQLVATVYKYMPETVTLIIVPSIQLVEQTYNDFLTFGFTPLQISRWSGDHDLNPTTPIIIASSSILLSKTQDKSILSEVDLLLVDECHSLKRGNEIADVVKRIPTRHKFGLTGTMPEEPIDQWNLIGKLGPILYELDREDMVSKGFISDAEIRIVYINYEQRPTYKEPEIDENGNTIPIEPTVNYEIELDFLMRNKFRNSVIKSVCSKMKKNTLVIVDRIEHGEILEAKLKEIDDKKVFFIRGEVEVEDREKARDIMEKNDNVICIAISKIFSTGINIKNLHYIVFASAGKAKVKLIQSIGRGVRLHSNKTKLYILDFADNLRYGMRHLSRRKELYEEEKFKVSTTQINERYGI